CRGGARSRRGALRTPGPPAPSRPRPAATRRAPARRAAGGTSGPRRRPWGGSCPHHPEPPAAGRAPVGEGPVVVQVGAGGEVLCVDRAGGPVPVVLLVLDRHHLHHGVLVVVAPDDEGPGAALPPELGQQGQQVAAGELHPQRAADGPALIAGPGDG